MGKSTKSKKTAKPEKTEKPEKPVKLKDFCDPLFCEYDVLYKRLKKFMDYIGLKMDQLKDKSGEISFYEEERGMILQLLKEMGESYLIKITSSKELGKNSAEVIENSRQFHERMVTVAENIPHEDMKVGWLNLIDLLSRKQAHDLNTNLMEKIKAIADQVTGLNLNYFEHLKLLNDIHAGLDAWVEKTTNTTNEKVNTTTNLVLSIESYMSSVSHFCETLFVVR
ncbi:hypothetical protein [Paenibacillus sp. V4I7]|uniref:hypothetical protein n=1 Tax=Paenibacillus sp. V4I7 TaxID=3042307 RepID=UPI0027868A5B|nr:hypothetical protein [Paenibacillus sp. V4I7]MDQ0902767.1 hypothetical protein [Paenibacillus sp. V4I7]